jgi:hypothetical protein
MLTRVWLLCRLRRLARGNGGDLYFEMRSNDLERLAVRLAHGRVTAMSRAVSRATWRQPRGFAVHFEITLRDD